ncbi:hypothetical protein LMG27177_02134 [Paraburkholderia fynbosensis]|uniref:Uncharacterized protein n=1 Tax=Paraburkholderia fynbosensis TaxID=1200993 RepID=A0A6J5FY71_9BURK|nr:hypothetical protein LMG27177_02134 [Paraburkholderia fynbosensis]
MVNEGPMAKGLMLKVGSVVDATLISAPGSTKNNAGTRDPGMRSTQKGGNWYFGMRALDAAQMSARGGRVAINVR